MRCWVDRRVRVVVFRRHCHAASGLRFHWRANSQTDAENSATTGIVSRLKSFSKRFRSTCGSPLACGTSKICWRSVEWRCLTRPFCVGEPFRTDDRDRATKASPEASYDLASRRGLSENRRPNGLPLAGRGRRRRGPRCTGPVEAKQACCAETDAQAFEEICLRSGAIGHRRLAFVQRRGPGPWDRTPA